MTHRLTLVAAILLAFSASILARARIEDDVRPACMPAWQCRRIVSMAPSITETLFALGLGERVVGVTRYCRYPPEVEEIKKSGNVGDNCAPNFEAIVALKPNLVILLTEQSNWLPAFKKLGIETLVVSNQTVDGVIDSFGTIGRVCGRGPEGRRMQREFRDRLERLQAENENRSRPSVLVVIDRTQDGKHLSNFYVAADDKYFDKMIELAGGQNAYDRRGVRYPILSAEGIMSLNPDVIIDITSGIASDRLHRKAILEQWNQLKGVRAVENGRVLILDQNIPRTPGPRFLQLVEYLANELH